MTTHIRMTNDQADRYRQVREIPPGGEIRPALLSHLQDEIEGLGALDNLWTAEVVRER
ncbi:hypothetical protein [Nocardiopsis dassonvillei]|uniref:hypothetical protein n=1 Tax=Nocardiopsis dassonvillei TaxID=2014 RepID=UPI00362830EF